MKNLLTLGLIFFCSLNLSYGQGIKIITYNIRYDNPDDGENSWTERRESISELLQFYEPDIFGIQEGLNNQVSYLDSSLNRYKFVGVGRDGADKGEYSAIFYKTGKFKVIKSSTFWLSETPGTVSTGWDAALRRICTYAVLENIQTGKKLMVLNTHFDHKGKIAREKSAGLIAAEIDLLNRQNLPVILMGDFNSEPNSKPVEFLSGIFNDSKMSSLQGAFGPSGTFNGFEISKPVKKRIDYIFTSRNNIQVIKYAALTDSRECRYPSDHLPVYAEIKLIIE